MNEPLSIQELCAEVKTKITVLNAQYDADPSFNIEYELKQLEQYLARTAAAIQTTTSLINHTK